MLNDKDPQHLKAIIEELAVFVERAGGLRTLDPIDRPLFDNVLSYHKKLDDLSKEEINIIWETASSLLRNKIGIKPKELVQKIRSDKHKEGFLYGKYWIFPRTNEYFKCKNHVVCAESNMDKFVEALGIDGLDYIHALSSRNSGVLSLIMKAGGIMADFVKEDKRKAGKFQLCQTSLPWLKAKLSKMAIFRSHIRIVSPYEDYVGENTGIYFVYRRPK